MMCESRGWGGKVGSRVSMTCWRDGGGRRMWLGRGIRFSLSLSFFLSPSPSRSRSCKKRTHPTNRGALHGEFFPFPFFRKKRDGVLEGGHYTLN